MSDAVDGETIAETIEALSKVIPRDVLWTLKVYKDEIERVRVVIQFIEAPIDLHQIAFDYGNTYIEEVNIWTFPSYGVVKNIFTGYSERLGETMAKIHEAVWDYSIDKFNKPFLVSLDFNNFDVRKNNG